MMRCGEQVFSVVERLAPNNNARYLELRTCGSEGLLRFVLKTTMLFWLDVPDSHSQSRVETRKTL